MPGGNKTGPDGQGPMTGRGLGYCAGYPTPGFANSFFGRGRIGAGRAFGRGSGFGFRGGRSQFGNYYPNENPPYQTLSKKDEINILEVQAKNIKKELEQIQNRISELGPSKNNKQ